MPLPSNSRLGPYEIKSQLGAGGMGEVYRARDSRLNRDVAIKILRIDGAGSSDLRIRFEREARAVAALNHPNIVAVYDFGVEQDQQYIVSELIEGESLRSLLRGKSVASRKLVDIATQIADGLAAAHSAGIVHRDLKPENIMIAKDGRVKILDFGLARQARASGILVAGVEDATLTEMPEAHRNITGAGAVMGTPNYMSPEQALGRELDYHSDQFSFGLILYELASGKQAFTKTSSIETMAAIVREEPAPMDEKLPPPLRWIIDRCLAKEPEQRYESTRDLYRDLKNLRDHFSEAYTSGAFPQTPAVVAKPSYKRFVAVGLGCMLLGALLVYVLKPSGQNVGDLHYTPFASNARGGYWSPDGKAIAYTSEVKGIDQTFIKFVNTPIPIQLTHEQKGAKPIGWSGDGSHIIVQAASPSTGEDKILSFAGVGGGPEFIMNAPCLVCRLSTDGKVLAGAVLGDNGIFSLQISDPIGSKFVLYRLDDFSKQRGFSAPEVNFSPDGKSILFIQNSLAKNQEAWLLPYPVGSKSAQHILPPLTSQEGIVTAGWMPDSRHAIVSLSGASDAPNHLWMADTRSNRLYPLTNGIGNEESPRVSPNGKSLLLTQLSLSGDLVSISLPDGVPSTLVSTGHRESMPYWSASKEEFVWVSDRSGFSEIWLRSPDGSDRPVVTARDFPGEQVSFPSLSPTGDRIVFSKYDEHERQTLWIASLSGGDPIRLTNAMSGAEFAGVWSPDGSRFAYESIAGGKVDLMLVKTSGGAEPVLLRVGYGLMPTWSPSGDWITFCDDQGWILISPDGKSIKRLGSLNTPVLAFSGDGKLLYGVLNSDPKSDQDTAILFSLNPSTLERKAIRNLGTDFRPSGDSFSLSPDGKSLLYSTAKRRTDLWMLKGFKQPSWLDRFALN